MRIELALHQPVHHLEGSQRRGPSTRRIGSPVLSRGCATQELATGHRHNLCGLSAVAGGERVQHGRLNTTTLQIINQNQIIRAIYPSMEFIEK